MSLGTGLSHFLINKVLFENEGGDRRNPLNHFLYDNLSCLLADLIKYGIPEDIWFHVDDMSSAHVYLRLNKNQRLEGKI